MNVDSSKNKNNSSPQKEELSKIDMPENILDQGSIIIPSSDIKQNSNTYINQFSNFEQINFNKKMGDKLINISNEDIYLSGMQPSTNILATDIIVPSDENEDEIEINEIVNPQNDKNTFKSGTQTIIFGQDQLSKEESEKVKEKLFFQNLKKDKNIIEKSSQVPETNIDNVIEKQNILPTLNERNIRIELKQKNNVEKNNNLNFNTEFEKPQKKYSEIEQKQIAQKIILGNNIKYDFDNSQNEEDENELLESKFESIEKIPIKSENIGENENIQTFNYKKFEEKYDNNKSNNNELKQSIQTLGSVSFGAPNDEFNLNNYISLSSNYTFGVKNSDNKLNDSNNQDNNVLFGFNNQSQTKEKISQNDLKYNLIENKNIKKENDKQINSEENKTAQIEINKNEKAQEKNEIKEEKHVEKKKEIKSLFDKGFDRSQIFGQALNNSKTDKEKEKNYMDIKQNDSIFDGKFNDGKKEINFPFKINNECNNNENPFKIKIESENNNPFLKNKNSSEISLFGNKDFFGNEGMKTGSISLFNHKEVKSENPFMHSSKENNKIEKNENNIFISKENNINGNTTKSDNKEIIINKNKEINNPISSTNIFPTKDSSNIFSSFNNKENKKEEKLIITPFITPLTNNNINEQTNISIYKNKNPFLIINKDENPFLLNKENQNNSNKKENIFNISFKESRPIKDNNDNQFSGLFNKISENSQIFETNNLFSSKTQNANINKNENTLSFSKMHENDNPFIKEINTINNLFDNNNKKKEENIPKNENKNISSLFQEENNNKNNTASLFSSQGNKSNLFLSTPSDIDINKKTFSIFENNSEPEDEKNKKTNINNKNENEIEKEMPIIKEQINKENKNCGLFGSSLNENKNNIIKGEIKEEDNIDNDKKINTIKFGFTGEILTQNQKLTKDNIKFGFIDKKEVISKKDTIFTNKVKFGITQEDTSSYQPLSNKNIMFGVKPSNKNIMFGVSNESKENKFINENNNDNKIESKKIEEKSTPSTKNKEKTVENKIIFGVKEEISKPYQELPKGNIIFGFVDKKEETKIENEKCRFDEIKKFDENKKDNNQINEKADSINDNNKDNIKNKIEINKGVFKIPQISPIVSNTIEKQENKNLNKEIKFGVVGEPKYNNMFLLNDKVSFGVNKEVNDKRKDIPKEDDMDIEMELEDDNKKNDKAKIEFINNERKKEESINLFSDRITNKENNENNNEENKFLKIGLSDEKKDDNIPPKNINIFQNINSQKEENKKNKEEKKEKKNLFENLFQNKEQVSDSGFGALFSNEINKNKSGGLFGDQSSLFGNNNKKGLFEGNDNKNGGSILFGNNKKENEKIINQSPLISGNLFNFQGASKNDNNSLFGNNKVITFRENKNGLFGNNNKGNLFGNNNNDNNNKGTSLFNDNSLFGNENKSTLSKNKMESNNKGTLLITNNNNENSNKSSLFGVNNNSLFGENKNNNSLFGINNNVKNINKNGLFGTNSNNALMGANNKVENISKGGLFSSNNNEKYSEKGGLFGPTQSNNNSNKGGLFDSGINKVGLFETKNIVENKNTNGLFGSINNTKNPIKNGLFGINNNVEDTNKGVLFGTIKNTENDKENGLFGSNNNLEKTNKSTLFGVNNNIENKNEGGLFESNKNSLFGDNNILKNPMKEGLFGKTSNIENTTKGGLFGNDKINENKNSLFEKNNKNAIFGENNDLNISNKKELFVNNNIEVNNKSSLFGNINYLKNPQNLSNKIELFGKNNTENKNNINNSYKSGLFETNNNGKGLFGTSNNIEKNERKELFMNDNKIESNNNKLGLFGTNTNQENKSNIINVGFLGEKISEGISNNSIKFGLFNNKDNNSNLNKLFENPTETNKINIFFTNDKKEEGEKLTNLIIVNANEKEEKEKTETEIEKEKKRLENEILKEKMEKEKLLKEKMEREKIEKKELEKKRNEKREKEKIEKEKKEKERKEKSKIEREKKEKERLEKEKKKREKREREILEKERKQKEKLEKEKLKKERLENERKEKLRIEKEKKEKILREKKKKEEKELRKERIQLKTKKQFNTIFKIKNVEKEEEENEEEYEDEFNFENRENDECNEEENEYGHHINDNNKIIQSNNKRNNDLNEKDEENEIFISKKKYHISRDIRSDTDDEISGEKEEDNSNRMPSGSISNNKSNHLKIHKKRKLVTFSMYDNLLEKMINIINKCKDEIGIPLNISNTKYNDIIGKYLKDLEYKIITLKNAYLYTLIRKHYCENFNIKRKIIIQGNIPQKRNQVKKCFNELISFIKNKFINNRDIQKYYYMLIIKILTKYETISGEDIKMVKQLYKENKIDTLHQIQEEFNENNNKEENIWIRQNYSKKSKILKTFFVALPLVYIASYLYVNVIGNIY